MPYPPGYRHPTFRPEGMPWVEETWLPDLERPFVERTEPLPSPWTFHCDPEIIAAAELQSMERQLDVLRNRHIPKTSVSTTYGRGVKVKNCRLYKEIL
ncbi:hypothetical protein B566_EDAN007846 [Ephemera danica]|nr:hypothetical protein B566_EDAN007846 [Ephemera danica]